MMPILVVTIVVVTSFLMSTAVGYYILRRRRARHYKLLMAKPVNVLTVADLIDILRDYNPRAEVHLDVRMNDGGAAGRLRGVETEPGDTRLARLIWLVS